MNDGTEGSITVHKLNAAGQEVWQYPGTVLDRNDSRVTLEARFDREDIELEGLHLRTGDRFLETFYNDRWYNIFAVFDVNDDHLKGWYCNITRPARIIDNHVYADDLALDLVVTPDGEMQVLDVDEFTALQLTPEDRQLAMNALEELKTLAATRSGPFSVHDK
jgi:predicted RNA-binding protein associated with RNAse of E/G family